MVWLWGKVYLRGRSRSATAAWASGSATCAARSGALVDALVGAPARGRRSARARPRRCRRIWPSRRRPRGRRPGPAPSASTRCCSPPRPAELVRGRRRAPPRRLPRAPGRPRPRPPRCACVLELSRSLSPYYWLNIADPEFPFGGLIEHTNYIPRERYGGRHVLYISKYLFTEQPALERAATTTCGPPYRPFLQRINPAFDDSWVLARHHFKAAYAQPVIPCNYSQRDPAVRDADPRPLPRLHGADLPRGPRPELRRALRQPRRRGAARRPGERPCVPGHLQSRAPIASR